MSLLWSKPFRAQEPEADILTFLVTNVLWRIVEVYTEIVLYNKLSGVQSRLRLTAP